jgi:hypothetical protein
MTFDFDSIKTDLKNKLSLLSSWSKILFYGVYERLIDVVAYGIEKLAYLVEVYYRESTWETAEIKESLVNQSPYIGYIPYRTVGASGEVSVNASSTFSGSAYTGVSVTIPKWTQLQNTNKTVFAYTTETEIYGNGTSGSLSIAVKEGTVKTYTYEAAGTANEIIPLVSNTVENDYIQVDIVDSNGTVLNAVNICGEDNLTDATITNPEKLYFLTDTTNYYCEVVNASTFEQVLIKFGDNVYGRQLATGQLVKITYAETNGAAGNITQADIITQFAEDLVDANGDVVTLYVTNDDEISNGTDIEDIEHIRNYGPQLFAAGYRCGGDTDWKTVLEASGYIYRANVANGEELGYTSTDTVNKVYVTAISTDGSTLTSAQKDAVVLYLKDKNKKGVTEIVSWFDPAIIFLMFKIEATITSQAYTTVDSLIDTALTTNYGILNVDFQKNVYWSNYTKIIDSVLYIDHHETEVLQMEKNKAATLVVYEIAVSYPSSETSIAADQIYLQQDTLEIWIHRKRAGVWDDIPYLIGKDVSGTIVGKQGDLTAPNIYTITSSYISYTTNKIGYYIDTIYNNLSTYGVQNPQAADLTGYIISIAYKTQDGAGTPAHLEDVRLPESRCITDIDTDYIFKTLSYS